VYCETVQNVNEFHNRIVTAEEGIINEVPANTWQETEYCLNVYSVTNGAHKKLCEGQCLKMY
jgi:hypothetical protein